MVQTNNTQNRLKSKVVWITVAAQLLGVLVALGVITPTNSDLINKLIVAALEVLVAFGVLNNPTTPDAF